MRIGCWFGRHDYVKRVEGGEAYRVCTACGKEAEPPDHWGTAERDGEPGWDAPSGAGGTGGP